MSVVSAVCTSQYKVRVKDGLKYYLRFNINDTSSEKCLLLLEVDENYNEIKAARILSDNKKEFILTEKTQWMQSLFYTWQINKESFDIKTCLKDTYYFQLDEANIYSCEFNLKPQPKLIEQADISLNTFNIKPTLARFLRKDKLISTTNGKEFYLLEFQVKSSQGQVRTLRLDMDINFEFIQSASLSATDKLNLPLDPSATWHIDLFTLWKNEGQLDARKYLYSFTKHDNNHYLCDISKPVDEAIDSFFIEGSSKDDSFFTSLSTCFSCFFPPDKVFKPYVFDKRNDSKLDDDQIDAIEEAINLLEKERGSLWYPNKERKKVKIEALKSFLEQSTTWSSYSKGIIKTINQLKEENPELILGRLSSRTASLLENLIYSAKQRSHII
ncbi:MAG: hypothetical protein H0U70_09890 [Tatlockia sp.]|nr:hypothetical protein [Tatlockia sp.]